MSSHGKNNIIFYFSFEALIDKVNIKLNNSKSFLFIYICIYVFIYLYIHTYIICIDCAVLIADILIGFAKKSFEI